MVIEQLTDRIMSCLLGAAIGDAMGAPHEFKRKEEIDARLIDEQWTGEFTDDFESIIAVAEVISKPDWTPELCLANQYHWWRKPPYRGYGPSIDKSMLALGSGHIQMGEFSTHIHANGSYGNGALVRAIPVALAYSLANSEDRDKAVKDVVSLTHSHPDAIRAAVDFSEIIASLVARDEWPSVDLTYTNDLVDAKFGEHFQIHSWHALRDAVDVASQTSPLFALRDAISLGGDTDTIACLVGAMQGSWRASSVWPNEWAERLNNNPDFGLKNIIKLAQELASVAIRNRRVA